MFAAVSQVTKSTSFARGFSTTAPKNSRVAVLGAAGGIGQPLSLLLKNSQLVSELSLYDIVNTPGVAADLSHISTPAKVVGYNKEQIADALKGCKAVVIPAGVPRKPGMTRDDLFNTNASIVKTLAEAVAANCPEAAVLIISNPVNSTVPIVAETFKKLGVYNPKKLFGVTTLDITRAKTFVAEAKGTDVYSLDIPVVGGHAGKTILPLLSQNNANLTFTEEELKSLTHRIQFGGDEVVQAKNGAGSATLSMAYAGAHFTLQVLRALNGEKGIVECSFVESSVVPNLPFFSSQIELGVNGVEKIRGLGKLSAFEEEGLKIAVPELESSIAKGIKFANN